MRIMRSQSSRQHCSPNRRGVVFHYYMTYLLLSSMLMASSGVCIHAVLKADAVDSRIARNLQTLVRLEQQLRDDSEQQATATCQPQELILQRSEQTTRIIWTLEDNVARRTVMQADAAESFDRFVFTRGTQLQFLRQGPRVLFSLHEDHLQQGSASGQQKSQIQIELWIPEPEATAEISS